MNSQLTLPDYLIIFAYVAMIAGMTAWFTRMKTRGAADYFLGGHAMPVWMVAVSVVSTAQSAATFLGGPDQGFRGNFTYLATNLGALLATLLVARFLMPRFFALNVRTVYELLEQRFGAGAKTASASMFLIGRVFAHGARLYMAGLAVSLMLFSNTETSHVLLAVAFISLLSLAYTLKGGLVSVIYSDVLQASIYVTAALATVGVLLWTIPADLPTIFSALASPPDGAASKLTLLDFSLDFSPAGAFNFWSCLTGFTLLHFASYGLDQDLTQRVLACPDSKSAARAMLSSVAIMVPIMLVFIFIGSLLYVFYERADLMGDALGHFEGSKVEVFMHYILNEMPAGLRGLVIVGVLAACPPTSGYNAMASVLVSDVYAPWRRRQGRPLSDAQELRAGRISMLIAAAALFLMAWVCLEAQRASEMPLLPFALGIMVFSYSGLLGVYAVALFSRRGNTASVIAALLVGFLATLLMQPFLRSSLPGWATPPELAFTWQLCIGAALSALVCALGKPTARAAEAA